MSYQIAGARDRVLHFRALNGKGQPLASPSSFSSDFLFGDGVSGQKSYSGAIDRLEVVFAADEEAVELPFTLTDFAPAGKPGTSSTGRRRLPVPPSPAADSRARAAAGPPEPRSCPGRSKPLRAQVRPHPESGDSEFEKAFGVGRLRLTRVQLQDGSVIEPPPSAAAGSVAAMRSRWDSAIRFGGSPQDGRLSTALTFYMDSKARPDDVKAVQGVLTLRFPRALDTVALDDLAVDRQAALRDLTITVVARGRKSVTLQTNRDGDRVYYVRLIGADGQALGFFGPNITEAPDGAWRFELSPLSPAVRAEVTVVREVDQKSYPVTLTPR